MFRLNIENTPDSSDQPESPQERKLRIEAQLGSIREEKGACLAKLAEIGQRNNFTSEMEEESENYLHTLMDIEKREEELVRDLENIV